MNTDYADDTDSHGFLFFIIRGNLLNPCYATGNATGMKVKMKHVFISYVRENSDLVDKLATTLQSRGIHVWLDREHIKPGRRWKDAIIEGIQKGTFFIACFSKEYSNRAKSYMNEELALAVEELRQRPTDQSWFIPVLLNDCQVPKRSIGPGETLQSIQYVQLYEDWNKGIEKILNVIQAAAVDANSNNIDADIDATSLCQAIFVVGAGAGQAINLFGELLSEGKSSGLDEVIYSLDRLGLASSQPGRFIASVMDEEKRNALLSTRSEGGEILPLRFQSSFRSIGELVQHRFKKEFRWFQFGQFLYMIPTFLVLESGTLEHLSFVSLLESFEDEEWLPSGARALLSNYCHSARCISANPSVLFEMANQISQIIFEYTQEG